MQRKRQALALRSRWAKAGLGVVVATLALAGLAGGRAWAVERRGGEDVDVRPEEVIDDDVLASGQVVTIAGTVRGDVIALAHTVVIRGRVEGDVIAAAQTIDLRGEVTGSSRLAAQSITVSGRIGRNLTTLSEQVTVLDTARVGGNWLAAAERVTLDGVVGRGLMAAGDQVRLAGAVTRDARLNVNQLVVEAGAKVGGTLAYRSPQAGFIDPAARIGAVRFTPVEHQPPGPPKDRPITVFQVVRFIGFVLFGLVLVSLFPRTVEEFGHHLERGPLASLLLGFAVLVAAPVALVFVALTAVGLPAALFLGAAYLGAIYVGQMFLYAPLVGWLARSLRRSPPPVRWSLVLGSTAATVLGLIPYVGVLFRLISASWALGLTVLVLRDAALGDR